MRAVLADDVTAMPGVFRPAQQEGEAAMGKAPPERIGSSLRSISAGAKKNGVQCFRLPSLRCIAGKVISQVRPPFQDGAAHVLHVRRAGSLCCFGTACQHGCGNVPVIVQPHLSQ